MSDSIPIIAFDESGNTGSDLLNKEQPIFVLASVNMSKEQAVSLLSLVQTQENSNEAKFNRLKRGKSNYSKIDAFLSNPLISKETFFAFGSHKDYALCAQIVDRLIEPQYHQQGASLYAEGWNIIYTNVLWYIMPHFISPELSENLKRHFVNVYRKNGQNTIEEFIDVAKQAVERCSNDFLKDILVRISRSKLIIENDILDFDKYLFDNTLSGFFTCIDQWNRKFQSDFDVIYDASKQMNHYGNLIERVRKINIENQIIGSDFRTWQLPFRVKNLNEVDSEENPLIQIADLMSGITNHLLKGLAYPTQRDELWHLINGYEEKFNDSLHLVWPQPAFTPEDLGVVNDGKEDLLSAIVKHSKSE